VTLSVFSIVKAHHITRPKEVFNSTHKFRTSHASPKVSLSMEIWTPPKVVPFTLSPYESVPKQHRQHVGQLDHFAFFNSGASLNLLKLHILCCFEVNTKQLKTESMSSVLENYIKPPSSPLQQFYRRQLPQECISFCSDEGSVFGVSGKMRMCERG